MEAFDLKKALAGEPVMLESGEKAYVRTVIDNAWHAQSRDSFDKCLVGYIERSTNYIMCWHETGKAYHESISIKCMWEEPRPRVQLDLPCPLKELNQGEHYYYADFWIDTISKKVESIVVCGIFENSILDEYRLNQGRCFATEEDAQEWLDAMRNARR